jgi:hypothetical protein
MYCGLLDVVHGDSWKHAVTPVRFGSERSDFVDLLFVIRVCIFLAVHFCWQWFVVTSTDSISDYYGKLLSAGVRLL